MDDEAMIRMLAAEAVLEAGLEVIECGNADGALDYLSNSSRADEVCLVVTDVRMPGTLNGVELAHYVAEHCPWVHIIITSGWHDDLGRLPPKAEFLPKPWLINRITQTAQRARAEC
ncbi:response regulator [Chelatococcus reniformis]|uniref:response regulator n=1 Tax=Chelatococcus reniformis TaxID=1494448 RepID=UPI00166EDF9C|nr:response regulator [Chelatococcus reniformis]